MQDRREERAPGQRKYLPATPPQVRILTTRGLNSRKARSRNTRHPHADQTRSQDQRDGCQSNPECRHRHRKHQNLQSDQNEQDRIEDLIHQFPEGIQMLAGDLGHGHETAMIPDQKPGHDDGDRA